ncbi:MAG: YfiR family protein [Bacteroidales bacterium]|nr:YfiR family protein [Bacteroidales bacterium]
MKKLKFGIILILFLGIIINLNAQVPKLQSIFIYNFTKYIEWPASVRSGDFVIGILGNSPIEGELNNLAAAKKVGSQPIVIKIYKSADEIGVCHVLFIPSSKSDEIGKAVSKIGQKNTLIITEKEGMASKGSSINFVIRENKQKFELNMANTSKMGLKVSSSLQQLAILVN